VRDRVARLEKLPPALAIRTFFDEIIDKILEHARQNGKAIVSIRLAAHSRTNDLKIVERIDDEPAR
jgi:hypothetical protein